MEKLRIVVSGFIGLYPTGGVTWDYIQYPLGLKMLGYDVYYVEDTMQYPTFQPNGKDWNDPSDNVQYLKETMELFGLGERWSYKDAATGHCFGLSLKKITEIIKSADVFINISEATFLRDEYLNIPKRVLIDSDPMFTQVQFWDDDNPEASFKKIKERYGGYSHLFSFGENIETNDCKVPTFGLKWHPTRQPICTSYWNNIPTLRSSEGGAFTTVMNWSTRNKMKFKNEYWGQKDVEFEKILNTPSLFKDSDFKVVVSCSNNTADKFEKEKIEKAGWKVLDPQQTISNLKDYQTFIASSLGEFSVAKETYVKSNSGWFSCRSACYLAAGKPVITQETGWSKFIPSGVGLFAFNNQETAIEALAEVAANLDKHTVAAKEIAFEYFDSNSVLSNLLGQIG